MLYNIEIDSINAQGCFSVCINKDGINHRCAFAPGDWSQLINFVESNGCDFEAIANEVNLIWTKEKIESRKWFNIETEAWDINEQLGQEKADQARLEIQYAEEQAWIENTVRTILATDVV